jgi:phospholipase C
LNRLSSKVAIFAIFSGLAGVAAITSGSNGAATTPTSISPASPIQHVVIIFQENHSFDNVFGVLCTQNPAHRQPCDGSTVGKLYGGGTIQDPVAADIVSTAVGHTPKMQTTGVDGGKMDGWSRNPGCTASANYQCFGEYKPNQIPNLAKAANAYAISDRTFESDFAGSWGGHLDLVAAQMDGFVGINPTTGSGGGNGKGWGCDSGKDAKWRASPSSPIIMIPSCVPARDGSGPYRPSPAKWIPTIMDRLDAAKLTWRFYTVTDGSWAICPSFADCRYTNQFKNEAPVAQILTDARSGSLANYSIALPEGPTGKTSQHNGTSMIAGDNWIGQMLTALENGPEWKSTVVFITYDDCGCFADHVPPPAGLGIREPMVIVSPWVKPASTDSNPASFSSMLAFTEHLFALQPLYTTDASAYDYANSFDFSQTPLAPTVNVMSPVPPSSQSYLRAHPMGNEDDDT